MESPSASSPVAGSDDFNSSTTDILSFLSQLGSQNKAPTADTLSPLFTSSLPVSTVFPFFMPTEMSSSSTLSTHTKPSTPTLGLSSDTLMASSSVISSPSGCNHMDMTSCTGAYYDSYHRPFADANPSAVLTDTCANIAGNGIFGSMPLLSSQHQVLPQTSVFPVLASSPPIQGSSSFSLLNNNEAMEMTPLHSTSQQDIFAQAGSYPENITSRAAAGAAGGGGGTRVLRRRSQVGSIGGGGLRRASSPGNSSRNHPYMPQTPASSSGAPLGSSPFGLIPSDPTALRRSNSIATLTPYVSNHQVSRSSSRSQKAPSSMFIIPAINQDGTCKRCANCYTAETPSWRRHPDTQELLCNACGLYLRLHRKARPITVDESGNIQVVRKNAAIQREPINLRPAAGYFGQTPVLDAPNQNHNQYPHGSMGLQLTSPVHSMDSISSPFNAMHMDHYSHPQASLHALVDEAAVQQYPNVARFPIGSDALQTKTLIENKCTDGQISGSLFSTSESSMQYSPSYESS